MTEEDLRNIATYAAFMKCREDGGVLDVVAWNASLDRTFAAIKANAVREASEGVDL